MALLHIVFHVPFEEFPEPLFVAGLQQTEIFKIKSINVYWKLVEEFSVSFEFSIFPIPLVS